MPRFPSFLYKVELVIYYFSMGSVHIDKADGSYRFKQIVMSGVGDNVESFGL